MQINGGGVDKQRQSRGLDRETEDEKKKNREKIA